MIHVNWPRQSEEAVLPGDKVEKPLVQAVQAVKSDVSL